MAPISFVSIHLNVRQQNGCHALLINDCSSASKCSLACECDVALGRYRTSLTVQIPVLAYDVHHKVSHALTVIFLYKSCVIKSV